MEQEITSQRICHYTKVESGLNILFEKRLRLNSLSKTNDPRESRPLEFLTFQDFQQQNNLDVDNANNVICNDIPKIIMEEWKVLCFTLDATTQYEKTNETFRNCLKRFDCRAIRWDSWQLCRPNNYTPPI